MSILDGKSIETLESGLESGLEKIKYDATEKMKAFSSMFKSSVLPEEVTFDSTEVVKDTGVTEITSRNDEGMLTRSYYNSEGVLTGVRSKNIDGSWTTLKCDDNGLQYLKEKSAVIAGKVTSSIELVPDVEVVKGNFTATIDEFGRPILNKLENVVLRDGEKTKYSADKFKDSSYKAGDQISHLMADGLGGPTSKENVVPQTENVNKSKFAKVENAVRKYTNEGKTVDYEVKTNYVGSEKRPSSFEPKITVDGEAVDIGETLGKEYEKIYNTDGISEMGKVATNIGEVVGIHHEIGVKTGIEAATITCAVSTVDNVSKYMKGDISAEEMVTDIAKDTGTAGVVGYGTGFITSAVSSAMKNSSKALIQSVGKSNIPAAVVSFGVVSYDSITDFAKGEIDTSELAYDLGENASSVAGGIAGAALAGAAAGSIVPGAGTVVGFGVGVVGGMVGTAIASEAYATAVETGSEGVEILADKAQEVASKTVEAAKTEIPDKVEDVKSAINSFATSFSIPIHV